MSTPVLAQPGTALAMLKIAGLHLVLPQNEIRALESMDNVERRDAESGRVGWVRYAQQRWPVYCLSQDLALLADVPAARRACVLLGAGQAGYVGMLCDDVSIVRQSLGPRHELPDAMRLPETPVTGLTVLEGETVACLTSAEHLASYLNRLVSEHGD